MVIQTVIMGLRSSFTKRNLNKKGEGTKDFSLNKDSESLIQEKLRPVSVGHQISHPAITLS